MKLEKAIATIKNALSRMRHTFGKTVFDEWVLFKMLGTQPSVLCYQGPRATTFDENFQRDIALLTDELHDESYATGHFYFTREAEGALYDVFLVVGPNRYVLFNSTAATMTDITQDPLWQKTQIHFVELSETFQTNPLR